MPNKPGPPSNEHILEIRYRPNSRILDLRGTWAEKISVHMELPEWRIIENRIDVFDKSDSFHVFVGFRNGGVIALDTPTQNYFPDKVGKLLTFLFGLQGFDNPLFIERLGVRSKFCTPFEGSFDQLRERYASRYLQLTDAAREAIGRNARLVDIGGPLNFADQLGNFNTMGGPMTATQFPQFFKKDEGFPDVGLYFDIDYWVKPAKSLSGHEVVSLVRNFATQSWLRHDRVHGLISGS